MVDVWVRLILRDKKIFAQALSLRPLARKLS